MKKILAAMMGIMMAVSLTACSGSGDTQQDTAGSQTTTAVEETAESAADAESTDSGEAEASEAESELAEDSASEADAEGDGTEDEAAAATGSSVLVVYFSATNTTEGVALKIAEAVDGDIFEIIPEDPYTDEDLNYNDDNSRSTIEMNDPEARPAIADQIENIGQYDVIFLGYPIWWGEAPRIIDTFMESYDFTGKTIVPFCTSGGSGVGSSASDLEAFAEGADWRDGTRLNAGDSEEEIAVWVDGLELGIEAE